MPEWYTVSPSIIQPSIFRTFCYLNCRNDCSIRVFCQCVCSIGVFEQSSVYKWMGYHYLNFSIIWTHQAPMSSAIRQSTIYYLHREYIMNSYTIASYDFRAVYPCALGFGHVYIQENLLWAWYNYHVCVYMLGNFTNSRCLLSSCCISNLPYCIVIHYTGCSR